MNQRRNTQSFNEGVVRNILNQQQYTGNRIGSQGLSIIQ